MQILTADQLKLFVILCKNRLVSLISKTLRSFNYPTLLGILMNQLH